MNHLTTHEKSKGGFNNAEIFNISLQSFAQIEMKMFRGWFIYDYICFPTWVLMLFGQKKYIKIEK